MKNRDEIKYESTADIIAKYLLSQCPMSQKKLHKMLYFCYVTYLLDNNDKGNLEKQLFVNKFEAWIHGPVYAPLYATYRDYGYTCIESSSRLEITEAAKRAVDITLELYGDKTASELEDISHSEWAWQHARQGCRRFESCTAILDEKIIFLEYSNG